MDCLLPEHSKNAKIGNPNFTFHFFQFSQSLLWASISKRQQLVCKFEGKIELQFFLIRGVLSSIKQKNAFETKLRRTGDNQRLDKQSLSARLKTTN